MAGDINSLNLLVSNALVIMAVTTTCTFILFLYSSALLYFPFSITQSSR